MRSAGVSRRASDAIAEIVPLKYILANLATIRAGGGRIPGALEAGSLWNDDADWFAIETRRQQRLSAEARAVQDKADARAEADRQLAQAAASNAAEIAKLADFTNAQLRGLLRRATDAMDPTRRKVLLTRAERDEDLRKSPTVRAAILAQIETEATAQAASSAAQAVG